MKEKKGVESNIEKQTEVDVSNKKIKKQKEKKDKKRKDKKKKKSKQNKWGKYGTITTSDMYMKREEFMMWLSENKRMNVESITPQDERRLFEEYVECYNTATFPSKKFYNFKIWFEKEQLKKNLQPKHEPEMSTFNEEEQLRKELLEQKAIVRNQKFQQEYQNLHEFSDMVIKLYLNNNKKAVDMQKQRQLQELMRHQYQLGNHEAAIKLQKQLAPPRSKNQTGTGQRDNIQDYDEY